MGQESRPFSVASSTGINIGKVADIMKPSQQFDAQAVKESGAVIRSKIKKANVPITFVLNNSAGMAAVTYIIGDPTGNIAAKVGGSPSAPTSGTMSAAAFKIYIGTPENAFAIKSINYNASSDTAQFAQAFNVAYFESFSDITQKGIDSYIAAGRRNDQYNPLLQTMDLTEDMPVLNANAALLLTVLAGETVTLTLTPGVTKN